MPNSLFILALLQQLPLAEAGQLLVVTGIAFAVITLIASTSRFHHMIQLSEGDLKTVESRNDFFFVQVTRYLSKINRISSGFGLFIIQFRTEHPDKPAVQEELLQKFKTVIRSDNSDKLCLLREDCIAALIDTEESEIQPTADRLAKDIGQIVENTPSVSAFRIGASSFPMHGLSTQQVIDAAEEALEAASFESSSPIVLAPPPQVEEDQAKDETPKEIGALSQEDKNSALDPLTGVLRPNILGSYMRKYLSEIRRKREPAALLCVGINQMDTISKLHGEAACDDVTAGISQIIQRLTRDSDLIGRYDKRAFLVLATCSLQNGEKIAVRLREAVNKEIFLSNGKRIKTSISVGISAHPEHGRNLRDLFSGAHRALEVIREWNTSSCLVYDAAQHAKKD